MDKVRISKNLVLLRKSAGYTQDKVSKLLGISRSALAMYETGERIPTDDNKLKLAKLYNTKVEKIFYQ